MILQLMDRGILQQGYKTSQHLHLGSLFSIAQPLHREQQFQDCSIVRANRNASHHQKSSSDYFVYLTPSPTSKKKKKFEKLSFFSKLAMQCQPFQKHKSKSKD